MNSQLIMHNNKVGVYHYKSCNSLSLISAMKQGSIDHYVSDDIHELLKFKKIIIPGVGNMSNFFNNYSVNQFKDKITKYTKNGGIVYGICLGMQVFLENSEESKSKTLGLVAGNTISLKKDYDLSMNVGFKKINFDLNEKIFINLFKNISTEAKFYFLHKYHCLINEKLIEKVYSNFEKNRIISAIYKNNILGTQFHPELSGQQGIRFLKNFSELDFNI